MALAEIPTARNNGPARCLFDVAPDAGMPYEVAGETLV